MTAPRTFPCGEGSNRGCGKPIVWGMSTDGKRIPMAPSAPVYHILNESEVIERFNEAMVSHFAACPQANNFSGGGRKA